MAELASRLFIWELMNQPKLIREKCEFSIFHFCKFKRRCRYSVFLISSSLFWMQKGLALVIKKLIWNNLLRKVLYYGAKYSRMDQVKFFKGCFPQILIGLFLNTLSYILNRRSNFYSRILTWRNCHIKIYAFFWWNFLKQWLS